VLLVSSSVLLFSKPCALVSSSVLLVSSSLLLIRGSPISRPISYLGFVEALVRSPSWPSERARPRPSEPWLSSWREPSPSWLSPPSPSPPSPPLPSRLPIRGHHRQHLGCGLLTQQLHGQGLP
jgi:hypothetical protein